MEEIDRGQLWRLVINHGRIGVDDFDYDEEARRRFARLAGMEDLFDAYGEDGEEEESKEHDELRREIERRARALLEKEGVNVDKVLGREPTQDEQMESVLSQLEQMGISRATAEELDLTDLTLLKNGGRVVGCGLPDTPEMRRKLEDEQVEYTPKDGRLRVMMRVDVREGVSMEASDETRRLLDDNQIDYIRMAEGKKFFIPRNWHNARYPYTNSQLLRNLGKLAGVAAVAFLNPVAGVLVLITLKRMGLLRLRYVGDKIHLSSAEKKALREGLTAYRQDRKGTERYLYMDHGNICSMNAHDVPIPRAIRGVTLSPAQRESLRKGQLLTLRGKDGEEILARIDVTRQKSYVEYYRGNNRKMSAVPDAKSGDREKLEYIEMKGFEGIVSIFGKKSINLGRDAFLERYGMRQAYAQYLHGDRSLRRKLDGTLRECAAEGLVKEESCNIRR